jgi:hypothetical protein
VGLVSKFRDIKNRIFGNNPHQITMHLSSKNDRRYRSSFEARAIKKDLWQLYTGARTYYYDTEGIFVTD